MTVAIAGRLQIGGNTEAVLLCATGLYLATAAGDRQVVIWDVLARKHIVLQTAPAVVTALCWCPQGNELACLDEAGAIAVWCDVLPAGLPRPNEDPDTLQREHGMHPASPGAAIATY